MLNARRVCSYSLWDKGMRGPRTSPERRGHNQEVAPTIVSWYANVLSDLVSDCTCFLGFGPYLEKRKSGRYGLGAIDPESLRFSTTFHDLSSSKSPEGRLHQIIAEGVTGASPSPSHGTFASQRVHSTSGSIFDYCMNLCVNELPKGSRYVFRLPPLSSSRLIFAYGRRCW